MECTLQNTMASAIEALGMALPYNSSNPAVSKDKQDECEAVGTAIQQLLAKDLKPLDIVTRKSLENALRLIAVLGGSTNDQCFTFSHRKGGKYHINH